MNYDKLITIETATLLNIIKFEYLGIKLMKSCIDIKYNYERLINTLKLTVQSKDMGILLPLSVSKKEYF
jgi:hypothetical protein